MNDLTALRDLGEVLDQDICEPSAQLRHRVLSGIAGPPIRRERRLLPVLGTGRRLAITIGLAAALAAALLTGPTLRLWGFASTASAEAAQILDRAAVAARHQPVLTASPNQYVFVKSVAASAAMTSGPNGRVTSVKIQTRLREIWNSASGKANGLLREQPRSGTRPGHPTGPWQTTVLYGCSDSNSGGPVVIPGGCVPQRAYLAGLPTNTQAMLTYLYRHSHGQNPPDQQAFITAGDLIRENYVRPAALAALFTAVAQIPGVGVVQNAVDAYGRHGIAVVRIDRGISEQLIFDPRTYAYIGEREVVVQAGGGLKAGTVLDSTAILAVAIVKRAGQLP